MPTCRGCGAPNPLTVLDLGRVPAADLFPPAGVPPRPDEADHPLAMTLCPACGLAQLEADDTAPERPLGVEPQALRDQAREAVVTLASDGWLPGGGTAREFPSPHGGGWLPLMERRGYRVVDGPADVVLDSFGLMHEPDQRRAFAQRAAATAPDGVLLIQFHSLVTIVTARQWNALRHGHYAYYSLTALMGMLRRSGMRVRRAWEFDLYGGTVLLAATHQDFTPALPGSPVAARLATIERRMRIADPRRVAVLAEAAHAEAAALRRWLEHRAATGSPAYAYGASSRSVALLHAAGADRTLLAGVADAAPGKQGRRMPGTDVPIISPAELVAARPVEVLLTVPDLLPELERALPELRGRWLLRPPAAPQAGTPDAR